MVSASVIRLAFPDHRRLGLGIVAGGVENVLRNHRALSDRALALQCVNSELDILLERQPTLAHAIAKEILGHLGTLTALGQDPGKDLAGFGGMLAGIVERLGRALDEGLGLGRIRLDPVTSQNHEAAGDIAQHIGIVKDRARAAFRQRCAGEDRLPIANSQ
ncbi:hypothetical protein [uncultured Paracoccus sp.]|uniref:hypothetical protein n=1 Tax=uncultured Paracoccus sp. TaxID=189685 RepID=UPI00261A0B6E|nr:hypothetical protein [uncultured Paracoccus sp.]